MALRVIFRVPPPVKITYVTYKMEHVWSVKMESMAIYVICRAPQTVKTAHVTCRTEYVSDVTLGGPGCIVKYVRIYIILILSSVYKELVFRSPE